MKSYTVQGKSEKFGKVTGFTTAHRRYVSGSRTTHSLIRFNLGGCFPLSAFTVETLILDAEAAMPQVADNQVLVRGKPVLPGTQPTPARAPTTARAPSIPMFSPYLYLYQLRQSRSITVISSLRREPTLSASTMASFPAPMGLVMSWKSANL